LKDTTWHRFIFIDEYNGDKRALLLQEGEGWGWYRVSEIDRLTMADHDKRIITLLSEYLRGEQKANNKAES